jgi:hypothetical protein
MLVRSMRRWAASPSPSRVQIPVSRFVGLQVEDEAVWAAVSELLRSKAVRRWLGSERWGCERCGRVFSDSGYVVCQTAPRVIGLSKSSGTLSSRSARPVAQPVSVGGRELRLIQRQVRKFMALRTP